MSYCDDFEYPVFYDEKKVRAKKDHKCCECGGAILKGEVYKYISGLWGRRFESYKTCPDCTHIRCEAGRTNPDGCGIALGELRGELRDMALYPNDENVRIISAFNATSAARGGIRIDLEEVTK